MMWESNNLGGAVNYKSIYMASTLYYVLSY